MGGRVTHKLCGLWTQEMEEGAIISSWHSNKPINEKDVHIRQGRLSKEKVICISKVLSSFCFVKDP